ncbi:hypothetical protein ACFLR7_01360 [Acidobacteriota bacterium]
MKKILSLAIVFTLMSGIAFAGVVKKTKAEVSFQEFGKFTTEQEIKITSDKKLTASKNKFKGKGVMGSTVGKMFLKSGETGEIINLAEMMIYSLNHKKKEYEVRPIEKIMEDQGEGDVVATDEVDAEEEGSNNIKIIRSEFKVEETGDKKNINDFSCRKYLVTWITEWENLETGQKGTDRLSTDVWTTPLTGELQQAQEQENDFNKEYMQRLGFDVDELQQAILGTNWLSILSSMGKGGMAPQADGSQFSQEMNKIEGYPVIIDGKYYAKREGGEEDEEEEESDAGDVKGMLGKFAKKAIGGKKKDDNEPAFTYYVEVEELNPESVNDSAFQVPSNYKNKGE